jgi:glycosyltransferase involved in cell wall biosynthesis
MKLLFITRKYPPAVGGMENFSFALAQEFGKITDFALIKWGHSQKWLFLFLPYALLKALILIYTKKISHVHLGDSLLTPIGYFLKLLTGVKTSVTAMGLDITYPVPIYQFLIPKFVRRMDKIICISRATLEECVKRGVPREKCRIITPGVYPDDFIINATREDLERVAGMKLGGKKVLVTVGRLVRRKGVEWFIRYVMVKLPETHVYLVVGDGQEREAIKRAIHELGMHDRVKMLGKVPDHELRIIYNAADVFIMPNIPVKGDMEGFGMVATEASSAGLPVVASDMEGIRDAVIPYVSGKLVEPGHPESFISALGSLWPSKIAIQEKIREKYSWDKIANNYLSIL